MKITNILDLILEDKGKVNVAVIILYAKVGKVRYRNDSIRIIKMFKGIRRRRQGLL